MSRWGRVDPSKEIVEFIDFDPEGLFDPEVVWVKIPEETVFLVNVIKLVYDGQDVKAASIKDAVEALKRLIAEARYSVEIGGIVMPDNVKIKTDRESQSILDSIVARMEKNPAMAIDFKTAAGWAKMDKAMAEAVSDAVAIHVQACFSREKALSFTMDDTAEAGDFKVLLAAYEKEKMDGWPENSIYMQTVIRKQAKA